MGSTTAAEAPNPVRVLLLAVAIACLTLTVAPAAGATTAATADRCEPAGDQAAVTVTPPTDEPTGPNGTVAVYRGSEIIVHLCQPDDGSRTLDAEGLDWATVLDDGDDRLRLRVDARTNDSLGSLASPTSVPGPSVTIVDRSVESTLVNGSIAVTSETQARELREAEATYLEREATLETQLDSLANATATVESGSSPDGPPIADTLAAWQAYRDASEALREELYEVADSRAGGPTSAAAIQNLGERSAATENRTTAALDEHDAALRDRQRSLTWSLRLRMIGLGLLGVVLGAAAGAVLPIRRARAARRRLARGEWTGYSRRVVLVPAAIGLLLICVGLGLLAATAGDVLVEVMLP